MSQEKTQDGAQVEPQVRSSAVLCRSCGYEGNIETYDPCISPYNDCRCPKCGSTNNQHNDDYQENLYAAMKTVTAPATTGNAGRDAMMKNRGISTNQ